METSKLTLENQRELHFFIIILIISLASESAD